jgi:hypothetical protein
MEAASSSGTTGRIRCDPGAPRSERSLVGRSGAAAVSNKRRYRGEDRQRRHVAQEKRRAKAADKRSWEDKVREREAQAVKAPDRLGSSTP